MPSHPSARHDGEVNALLGRLHSGCRRLVRFDDQDDSRHSRKSCGVDCGRGAGGVVSVLLRNASPPDEVHAELGRALASRFVASLHSITSSAEGEGEGARGRTAAVERGERIIRALCCGQDDAGTDDGRSDVAGGGEANLAYASVARAFFGHLRSLLLGGQMGEEGDDDDDDPLPLSSAAEDFVVGQWLNWCTLCEVFVLPAYDDDSDALASSFPRIIDGGGGIHVLHACVKNYSHISCRRRRNRRIDSEDDGRGNVPCGIAQAYESLRRHTSRMYLIRTHVADVVGSARCTSASSSADIGILEDLPSLFRSCVLAVRKKKNHLFRTERRLILSELLRAGFILLDDAASAVVDASRKNELVQQVAGLVRFLVASLISYLNQSIHESRTNKATWQHYSGNNFGDFLGLGYDWLRGMCDLSGRLLVMEGSGNGTVVTAISESIEVITATILPQFSAATTVSAFDMAPIYTMLASNITALSSSRRNTLIWGEKSNWTVAAFRLGSLSLYLQDDEEVREMCRLMLAIYSSLEKTNGDDSSDSAALFVGGILTALGCVFERRVPCRNGAYQLARLGRSMLLRGARRQERNEDCKVESSGSDLPDVISYSLGGQDFGYLMNILLSSISDAGPSPSIPVNNYWKRRPLSLSEQCSGLLLGLSLLHMSTSASQQEILDPDHVLSFLRMFLLVYPRMASRAVPSAINIARACVSRTTTKILLEFLASRSIVSDPHGAHLSWTFLSSLTNDGMPSAVRSSVVRLFPEMCSSNRRLFRRIRDVIGKLMVSCDPIVRISAAAALSDMAQLDLLRDVEHIIGWIQNRLADDEPVVVYYALETLRFLVKNEDLEFDLVIRVLEKRLCINLSDMETILGLNPLLLEGLVALLGEGGLEEEEDDDHFGDGSKHEAGEAPQASPQSIRAVSLLTELALSTSTLIKGNDGGWHDDEALFQSESRIRTAIYGSLSAYSPQVLGLGLGEGIRSWDASAALDDLVVEMEPDLERYLCLKAIFFTGIDIAKSRHMGARSVKEVDEKLLENIVTTGKTLLVFEEDLYGSSLFRGGGLSSSSHVHAEKPSRTRASKAVLSLLPVASDIRYMFELDPRNASATAIFYSIGPPVDSLDAQSQTEDALAQMSECFGDTMNESLLDPAYQAMQSCSLIYCMGNVWETIRNAEGSSREELADLLVDQMQLWSTTYGDFSFVAMAAFYLSVDDSAISWQCVATIQSAILEGQDDHLFESEDTKALCMGMIGARLSSAADSRVTGLIDVIEQSVIDNHGQKCCGSFFGLGLIMSHIGKHLITGGNNMTEPSNMWRKQLAQRIAGILLSSLNTCLTQKSDVILKLATSFKSTEPSKILSLSCSNLDGLLVKDESMQRMKAILIGLGHSLPVIAVISTSLLQCILTVVDKLPWGSGKAFATSAIYKNQPKEDLSKAISNAMTVVRDSTSGYGDALLFLASIGQFDQITENLRRAFSVEEETFLGSEDKLMLLLAGCAALGDLPGLACCFTPNMHTTVKKKFVANTVKMLKEIALDNAAEIKYKDGATICLGVLCAMSTSPHRVQDKMQKNTHNELGNIQAKQGSVTQGVLEEVRKEYSVLCANPSNEANRIKTAKKLCALFSMLECVALPGNFSRIIELTLKNSKSNELHLRSSTIKLLTSQLESRRRIDGGRGFVDLSTRLCKMPWNDLSGLIGPKATPIIVTSLPNLICQIPTSAGEELAKSLWSICRSEWNITGSSQSMIEFLVGLRSIFLSANTDRMPSRKQMISPALLRSLQKFTSVEIFTDLCADAVPTKGISTEGIWANYIQCLELVSSMTDADGLNCDVSLSNIFGMAVCTALFPKDIQRVESWIARQKMNDMSMADSQLLILAILAISTQTRSDDEIQASVRMIFDVMLVKGIVSHSAGMYLLAAKIAYWWEESQSPIPGHYLDLPIHRISNMSSFFVTRNLCFQATSLSMEFLSTILDAILKDMPSKLAVLCKMWEISADVSNRAMRISQDCLNKEGTKTGFQHRSLRDIAQLIGGGEILDSH